MDVQRTEMAAMADLSRIIINGGDIECRDPENAHYKTPLTPTSLKRGPQTMDSRNAVSSNTSSPSQPSTCVSGKENEGECGVKQKKRKMGGNASIEGLELRFSLPPGPYLTSGLRSEDVRSIAGWSYGASTIPPEFCTILARNMHERTGTVKQVAKFVRESLAINTESHLADKDDTSKDQLEKLILDIAEPFKIGVEKSHWHRALSVHAPEAREVLARLPRSLSKSFWLVRDLSIFPEPMRQLYTQRQSLMAEGQKDVVSQFEASAKFCVQAAIELNRRGPAKVREKMDASATVTTSSNHKAVTVDVSRAPLSTGTPTSERIDHVEDLAKTSPARTQSDAGSPEPASKTLAVGSAEKECRRALKEAARFEKEQRALQKQLERQSKEVERQRQEEERQKVLSHQAKLKAKSTGLMQRFLSRAPAAVLGPAQATGSEVDVVVQAMAIPVPAVADEKAELSDYQQSFRPFHVKANTTIAKTGPVRQHDFVMSELECSSSLSLPAGLRRKGPIGRKQYIDIKSMMHKISQAAATGHDVHALVEKLQDRRTYPIKVLKFHEDYRPAYRGTFTKFSDAVTGRRPFGRDRRQINYEYDSEIEWVEEEEGEDVMSVDDDDMDVEEATSEPDACSEGGWIEDDTLDPTNTQVRRPKVLKTLIPVIKGLVWEDEGYDDLGMSQFGMEILTGESSIDPYAIMISPQEDAPKPPALARLTNPDMVPKLSSDDTLSFIRLVHGSSRSRAVLIELARESIGKSVTKQALGRYFKATIKKVGRGSEARWSATDELIRDYGLSPIAVMGHPMK